MKKFIAILMAATMMLSVAACSNSDEPKTDDKTTPPVTDSKTPTDDKTTTPPAEDKAKTDEKKTEDEKLKDAADSKGTDPAKDEATKPADTTKPAAK